MIRRPPRSTLSSSSAASDVYKRQGHTGAVHNVESRVEEGLNHRLVEGLRILRTCREQREKPEECFGAPVHPVIDVSDPSENAAGSEEGGILVPRQEDDLCFGCALFHVPIRASPLALSANPTCQIIALSKPIRGRGGSRPILVRANLYAEGSHATQQALTEINVRGSPDALLEVPRQRRGAPTICPSYKPINKEVLPMTRRHCNPSKQIE